MEKAKTKSKLQIAQDAAYAFMRFALSFTFGYIAAKANIKNTVSPFSLAFLSVSPSGELSVTGAFFGGVLGFLTKPFSVDNFKYICADAVMLTVILISGKKQYKNKIQSPILTGTVCLLCDFIFLFADNFSLLGLAISVCEAFICGGSAYFAEYLLRAVKRKSRFDARDIISLNIAVLTVMCALDGAYVYGFSLLLIFTVSTVFISVYSLSAKVASAFTLPLCALTALLEPTVGHVAILYIPTVASVLAAKADQKYITTSYFLSYFALTAAINGIYGFNLRLLLSPLIAAVIFRIIPKSPIKKLASLYFRTSPADPDTRSCDELCKSYADGADSLALKLNSSESRVAVNSRIEGKLKKHLYLNGCRAVSIIDIYGTDCKHVFVLEFKSEKRQSAEAIRRKLCEISGKSFALCDSIRKNSSYTLKFEVEDAFKVECFAFFKAKHGEKVCGDSISAFKSSNSYYNILLADGMGSGNEAFIKSQNTVTLLKKLLKSDVSPNSAISSVNSSMELLKDEIGFSTVDLCRISLENATADFYKCGAYDSYILRNKSLIKMSGGGYPVGLTDRVTPFFSGTALQSGDIIVMMSDGISYTADKIKAQLLMTKAGGPETIARELIEFACGNTPAEYDDDMSVVVAKITKRGKQNNPSGEW